jgi:hypothetical protein
VACLAAVGSALVVRMLATMRRPPLMAERVEAPAVSAGVAAGVPVERPRTAAAPVAAEAKVNAPVSLAEARRKYREAG